MAAFALENPNKVWQRVRMALAGANEMSVQQFKALKLFLATQKGNPDLQFLSYTAAGIVGATGQILATGVGTVYAVWGKKPATATDVYLTVYDNATTDANGATDARVVLPFLVASDEHIYVSPIGVALANGLVMKAYTTTYGTTDSSAADAPSGFVLIGA